MTTAALIVAAGRGTRFGGDLPKQYVPVGGICAFRRSVETFLAHPQVGRVQPVIHRDDASLFSAAVEGLSEARLAPPVTGGATRAASVRRGLDALRANAPDTVLVHDAARPFVSIEIITDVIDALEQAEGAFAALPIVDALWRVKDGQALDPVPRDGLWRAQTPQGFHFEALLAAHQIASADAADDVEIARAAGLRVHVVRGAGENFKITTPDDLARAERTAQRLARKL
ncbi:MAG: 2-C-methyl-D-erythritol 4-phosphate cytidylyltransferase [Pseudomonadota bacterium]